MADPPFIHISSSSFCSFVRTLDEQSAHKILRMEGSQIVHPLADTDPLDRNGQLRLDADGYAALCRAIQFRKHNAGNRRSLRKKLCLTNRILPGTCVKDE